MEKTEKGKRGGGRKGIFRSLEAWKEAGKPNGFQFDHEAGKGHVKTAAERRLDELRAKRFELRNRHSTFYKRLKLEREQAKLAQRR